MRRSWRCGGVEGAKELEAPEVMRCVQLRMLEAVEGKLCLRSLLEISEVKRRVLRMLEPVERRHFLLEVL